MACRLFNRTQYWLLWEAFSHASDNVRRLFVLKYLPLSIAKYSVMQLRELEQSRVRESTVPRRLDYNWLQTVVKCDIEDLPYGLTCPTK